MNKICTIETIHSFKPHNNADKLELAKVLGFQVVVKKGDFQHGQNVVFVWPDTVAKPANWNSFLRKENGDKPVRFRSVKLRGEFSTGLVLPVSVLDQYGYEGSVENGVSVANILGVDKYLKDTGNQPDGQTKGGFPSHLVAKTDEDLAASCPTTEQEFIGKEVYATVKIDGQSLTIISNNGEIEVCSRNLSIKEGESRFWSTVRKYDLVEKIRGKNIAVQGEQYGQGIQGNKLSVEGVHFAIFNVKDLDTGKYYGYEELVDFCESIGVPMVQCITVHQFGVTEGHRYTFEYYQEMADKLKYSNGQPAEGLVLRPTTPVWSDSLGHMLSVKFINRNYND